MTVGKENYGNNFTQGLSHKVTRSIIDHEKLEVKCPIIVFEKIFLI